MYKKLFAYMLFWWKLGHTIITRFDLKSDYNVMIASNFPDSIVTVAYLSVTVGNVCCIPDNHLEIVLDSRARYLLYTFFILVVYFWECSA